MYIITYILYIYYMDKSYANLSVLQGKLYLIHHILFQETTLHIRLTIATRGKTAGSRYGFSVWRVSLSKGTTSSITIPNTVVLIYM